MPAGKEIPGIFRPVLVGGDRDYPPYEFLDKEGQPAGFNVDLTRAVAEVMGMKVAFHLGAWAGMRQALMNGGLDLLEGMTYSEDRSRVVDFAPHIIVNHAIFARRDTLPVANLDELAGKKVIVHRGGYMKGAGIFRNGKDLQTCVDELQEILGRARQVGLRSNGLGANPELTMVGGEDEIRDGQAKPGALSRFLGGEKGLEDPFAHVFLHEVAAG